MDITDHITYIKGCYKHSLLNGIEHSKLDIYNACVEYADIKFRDPVYKFYYVDNNEHKVTYGFYCGNAKTLQEKDTCKRYKINMDGNQFNGV